MALCFGVGQALWSRGDADRRVARIKSKLAEAKRLGFPTSEGEVWTGPQASSNVYPVVAPHVVRNKSIVTPVAPILGHIKPTLFRRKEDQVFLEKQLQHEAPAIQLIQAAFRARPNYFVPRNRDLGIMELFPDFAAAKLICNVFLAEVRLAVRRGDFRVARERMDWVHRIEEAHFREATILAWLTGLRMMSLERDELFCLYHEGADVEGLLEESVRAWESFPMSAKDLLGNEALSALVLSRQCDTKPIQRSWVELEARKRLKIKEPSTVYDFRSAKGVEVPHYVGTQRMMEASLDALLKAGDPELKATYFEQLVAAGGILDVAIEAGPPAVRMGGWVKVKPGWIRDLAKSLLKARAYPALLRVMLQKLRYRKQIGVWGPTGQVHVAMDGLGFSDKFEFVARDGVAMVRSVGKIKVDSGERPWVSIEYPPKELRPGYIVDTDSRRVELRRLEGLK